MFSAAVWFGSLTSLQIRLVSDRQWYRSQRTDSRQFGVLGAPEKRHYSIWKYNSIVMFKHIIYTVHSSWFANDAQSDRSLHCYEIKVEISPWLSWTSRSAEGSTKVLNHGLALLSRVTDFDRRLAHHAAQLAKTRKRNQNTSFIVFELEIVHVQKMFAV